MRMFLILLPIFLFSCQANVKEDKSEASLPVTLEGAVAEIVSELSEEDKVEVKDQKFCNLIMYHHGWGTGIRNSFGLWRGNTELLKSVCGSEECHPDDASMEIIYGVWNKLNGYPLRHKPKKEEGCELSWSTEITE